MGAFEGLVMGKHFLFKTIGRLNSDIYFDFIKIHPDFGFQRYRFIRFLWYFILNRFRIVKKQEYRPSDHSLPKLRRNILQNS